MTTCPLSGRNDKGMTRKPSPLAPPTCPKYWYNDIKIFRGEIDK